MRSAAALPAAARPSESGVPNADDASELVPCLGPQHCQSEPKVPAAWREELAARGVRTGRSLLHHEVAAADGTRKFLLQVRGQMKTNNPPKHTL